MEDRVLEALRITLPEQLDITGEIQARTIVRAVLAGNRPAIGEPSSGDLFDLADQINIVLQAASLIIGILQLKKAQRAADAPVPTAEGAIAALKNDTLLLTDEQRNAIALVALRIPDEP